MGDFKLGAAVLGRGLGRGFIYFDRLTVGPPDGGVPLPDRGGWGILRARPYPSSLQHARPMPKVSVIVPAYNEEATVLDVLDRVSEQRIEGVEFEIIVIDDGSTDCTGTLLEGNPHLYSELIRLKTNGGKGAAVKAGVERARGDYVLFQDADLEYDPADYAKLMLPVLRFDADVVIGSRMLAPTFTRVGYYWHMRGNRFLTFLFNILYNTTFTDIYSCYVLYRRELIEPAELRSTGWEQHAEILCRVATRGVHLFEVPVSYNGRTYGEGKKIRAHHILPVLATIIRGRFLRSRPVKVLTDGRAAPQPSYSRRRT